MTEKNNIPTTLSSSEKNKCSDKKTKNKNVKTFRDKIIEIEKHIEDVCQQFNDFNTKIKKEISEISENITYLSNEIKKLSLIQKNLIEATNKLFHDNTIMRNKITR